MDTTTIRTAPIAGQKPGTSGLRKRTRVFMEPHFLENYVQSIFDGIGGVVGKSLVLGGDGRYFNDRAAQVILRMAAANGARKVIVGRDALLSGPAGGIVGMARTAEAAGFTRVIGFDMGGTSTDVSLHAGRFERRHESVVAGVRVVAPTMRIDTVAAGGGSGWRRPPKPTHCPVPASCLRSAHSRRQASSLPRSPR